MRVIGKQVENSTVIHLTRMRRDLLNQEVWKLIHQLKIHQKLNKK